MEETMKMYHSCFKAQNAKTLFKKVSGFYAVPTFMNTAKVEKVDVLHGE